jgi:hypothetical protein
MAKVILAEMERSAKDVDEVITLAAQAKYRVVVVERLLKRLVSSLPACFLSLTNWMYTEE